MRIHLHTTPNQEIVPFDYQQKLSGVFYTWLGEKNEEHGRMSLHSYSWLKKGRMTEGGYEFPNGATWFISFYSEETLKKLMRSILNQPQMFNGLTVCNITIEDTPTLSERTLFYLGSPVYIQKHTPDLQNNTQYTFEDIESDEMLTQTLLRKMELAVQLLTGSDKSLQEIAQMLGFSSQSHFGQVFMRATGETPGQYRARRKH